MARLHHFHGMLPHVSNQMHKVVINRVLFGTGKIDSSFSHLLSSRSYTLIIFVGEIDLVVVINITINITVSIIVVTVIVIDLTSSVKLILTGKILHVCPFLLWETLYLLT